MVQNRYFAKPGKAEEVYAWRQHASDVLRQLGLSSGQVFRGAGGDQPDAVWQVTLDSATLVREGQIAQRSPEFQEVMRHMATLIRRFESANYLERRLVVDVKDTLSTVHIPPLVSRSPGARAVRSASRPAVQRTLHLPSELW